MRGSRCEDRCRERKEVDFLVEKAPYALHFMIVRWSTLAAHGGHRYSREVHMKRKGGITDETESARTSERRLRGDYVEKTRR